MEPKRLEDLELKMSQARAVIRRALGEFAAQETALAWTGGKDSTMVLWLTRQVCAEQSLALPRVFCIDEFDRFERVHDFMARQAREWGLAVEMLINQDLVDAAGGELGAMVQVADLNQRNRQELKRLEFAQDQFIFEAESFVGNHLMKTMPLNRFIEQRGIKALLQGLRRDEHPARAHDEHFMPREAGELSPGHMRINPILHFSERDLWDITLHHGVPHNSLYAQGYRSLGAKSTSQRLGDTPAWEQDLEHTGERGGRRQDKEEAMAQLRSLGYM